MAEAIQAAVRAWLSGEPVPAAMARRPVAGAPCVVIVGAGFSGTLAAAQLLRRATRPLHVAVVERTSDLAAGVAYSTGDARHLLNVPAARMSAWPDRPDSFVAWGGYGGDGYRPRVAYAQYLRRQLLDTAREAGPGVSLALHFADVRAVVPRPGGGFVVEHADAPALAADAVILATGHRAPHDPIAAHWRGPRTRFVADPWRALAHLPIAGDEPVIVLGSGLSAIDAVLSLTGRARTAPITCVSRHGFLPRSHAPRLGASSIDLGPAIDRALAGGLRGLVAMIRREIAAVRAWREVIDAVRPHSARIWAALPLDERAAFLRHVRPLWEVHRHRMAPAVAEIIEDHLGAGTLRVVAGRVIAARSSERDAVLTIAPRGGDDRVELSAAWVVNCTGPGSSHAPAPPLDTLIAAGVLALDPLGLGVVTGAHGEAISGGHVRDDLFVIGTLCKPRLWESTAVPELRVQAEVVAKAVLDRLAK